MSPVRKPSSVDSLRKATAQSRPAGGEITQPDYAPEAPARRPRPEKPVRFTLDLDRDRHRFLKSYADDIEADGASQVMRALLDELRDDPELAARVRARIWQVR